LIPSTILFIASDAFDIPSQIRLVDGDCCPEFDQWLELRRSFISGDFRRIESVGFGLPCLRDYNVNLSIFEERSMIVESDSVPNQIYDRLEDEFLVVVKSIPHSESVENANTFDSIRVKREFDSNVIDESDLHHEKHSNPRISTFLGIKID
jgi:hypothetical protein